MSDENTQLDGLISEVAQLRETIQDHPDRSTLDWDGLQATMADVVAGIQEIQQVLDKPQRLGALPGGGNQREIREYVREPYLAGPYAGSTPMDVWLAQEFLGGLKAHDPKLAGPSDQLTAAVKGINGHLEAMTAAAMDPGSSGFGLEAHPAQPMLNMLWEEVYLAAVVAQLFGPYINLPADGTDVALAFGNPNWQKGTAATASTAELRLATAKKQITVTEQLAEVNWTYNMDEEAVVAMMPAVRAQVVADGGRQLDRFLVNADATNAATGNINLDDADPADTEYYLSDGADGLRHAFLVDATGMGTDAGGDALALADLTAAHKDLGKYGVRPEQLAWIPGPGAYLSMLDIDGVKHLDTYGAQATILTGELAKFRGIPVVPSEAVPKTMADGKASTTAGNNTLDQIVGPVNRTMWKLGQLRGLTLEIDRNIQTRVYIMVISARVGQVQREGTIANQTHTAGIYNIL